MTGEMKKLLNAVALIVEFVVFAAFAFSTGLLYYTLRNPSPVPPEQQLDNDFVPLVLLILLFAGAGVSGLAFLVHFSFWLIQRLKAKREAAARFN